MGFSVTRVYVLPQRPPWIVAVDSDGTKPVESELFASKGFRIKIITQFLCCVICLWDKKKDSICHTRQ